MRSCSRFLFRLAWSGTFLLIPFSLSAGRSQEPTKPTPVDLTKMDIEDLMNIEVDAVYGASKFTQKVTDAPSYVTIITADEIAK